MFGFYDAQDIVEQGWSIQCMNRCFTDKSLEDGEQADVGLMVAGLYRLIANSRWKGIKVCITHRKVGYTKLLKEVWIYNLHQIVYL